MNERDCNTNWMDAFLFSNLAVDFSLPASQDLCLNQRPAYPVIILYPLVLVKRANKLFMLLYGKTLKKNFFFF